MSDVSVEAMERAMSSASNRVLESAAYVLLAGALLHLAIPLGGPAWYEFSGAPAGLIAMVKAGALRPALTSIGIGLGLAIVSAYAFSAAGLIRPLPLRRWLLGAVASVLLVRAIAFIPLAALRPQLLQGLCGKCAGVTPFLWLTSAICLFLGLALLYGAIRPGGQTREGGEI